MHAIEIKCVALNGAHGCAAATALDVRSNCRRARGAAREDLMVTHDLEQVGDRTQLRHALAENFLAGIVKVMGKEWQRIDGNPYVWLDSPERIANRDHRTGSHRTFPISPSGPMPFCDDLGCLGWVAEW